MTDEEKKAIEKLKNTLEQCHNSKECWENEDCTDCYVEVEDIMAIDTVLNLLEFKDKLIDAMLEVIEECRANDCLYSDEIDLSQIVGTEQIKQYFENLAKESGEIDED